MKVFKVPYDVKREEKIFGGYLSLRQVIYLMLAAGCFAIFFLKINIIPKVLFVSIFSTFFIVCAFLKLNGVNFDKMFILATKYLLRRKKFVYERCCK